MAPLTKNSEIQSPGELVLLDGALILSDAWYFAYIRPGWLRGALTTDGGVRGGGAARSTEYTFAGCVLLLNLRYEAHCLISFRLQASSHRLRVALAAP